MRTDPLRLHIRGRERDRREAPELLLEALRRLPVRSSLLGRALVLLGRDLGPQLGLRRRINVIARSLPTTLDARTMVLGVTGGVTIEIGNVEPSSLASTVAFGRDPVLLPSMTGCCL